jgi:hypothetical protein
MIKRPPIAACLQVFYQPRASTAYAMTVALSAQASGEDSLKILDIHLRGSGRRPRLLFNTPHIVLPAVPLGIASHAEFSIINDGYDNVDLRHRLPADAEHLPLQLKFPQGTMIGIARTSIPVIVCFQACKASSFTAVIEFLDHDGEPHSRSLMRPLLLICATSTVCVVHMTTCYGREHERVACHIYETFLLYTTWICQYHSQWCRMSLRSTCLRLHRQQHLYADAIPAN